MARRGHRVVVITADRGYDDTRVRYPRREITAEGVEIRRLPWTSFGKASLWHRALGMMAFIVQASMMTLLVPRLSAILFSTSPPFVGVAASLVGRLRRAPIAYWAMDLNPDQVIAMGKITPNGAIAHILEFFNRLILRSSSVVIALDPVMASRIQERTAHRGEIVVIPPWSPTADLAPVAREHNTFRAQHIPEGATVVMYSGNHSPSNPLRTLLDAAVQLRHIPSLRFMFVGSGVGKREVEEYIASYELDNVVSLPYQPISALGESLSAADVHVVSLGADMAGIIHPCKVYGAMAVGRPILYFGPSPSHVTKLLDTYRNGWCVDHDDVAAATDVLRNIATTSYDYLDAMGKRGLSALSGEMNPIRLCSAVCDILEARLHLDTRTRCAS